MSQAARLAQNVYRKQFGSHESSYEYIKDSMLADTSVFSILLMKWSKTQDLLELFVLETRTSWRRQTSAYQYR